jgi:hypothetical protein
MQQERYWVESSLSSWFPTLFVTKRLAVAPSCIGLACLLIEIRSLARLQMSIKIQNNKMTNAYFSEDSNLAEIQEVSPIVLDFVFNCDRQVNTATGKDHSHDA